MQGFPRMKRRAVKFSLRLPSTSKHIYFIISQSHQRHFFSLGYSYVCVAHQVSLYIQTYSYSYITTVYMVYLVVWQIFLRIAKLMYICHLYYKYGILSTQYTQNHQATANTIFEQITKYLTNQ